ncbi:MAG: four helix bundle protein [Bacteroidales bacterium]|nr:four helix bundle protein [Bacteroidales bacterium]
MKDNIVVSKSFAFSVSIVRMYQSLIAEKREFTLSKQLLRSGTSIGANIEEAVGGVSKKEFTVKMAIAYKEARETKYWLRLLYATDYLTNDQFTPILANCEELLKILYSIINTSRN